MLAVTRAQPPRASLIRRMKERSEVDDSSSSSPLSTDCSSSPLARPRPSASVRFVRSSSRPDRRTSARSRASGPLRGRIVRVGRDTCGVCLSGAGVPATKRIPRYGRTRRRRSERRRAARGCDERDPRDVRRGRSRRRGPPPCSRAFSCSPILPSGASAPSRDAVAGGRTRLVSSSLVPRVPRAWMAGGTRRRRDHRTGRSRPRACPGAAAERGRAGDRDASASTETDCNSRRGGSRELDIIPTDMTPISCRMRIS